MGIISSFPVANDSLSSSGGTVNGDVKITGNLTLKGSGNYGNKLSFGDSDYVHISEPSDDTMEIKARSIEFTTATAQTKRSSANPLPIEWGGTNAVTAEAARTNIGAAAAADFTKHTRDTTAHITEDERTKWNAKADSSGQHSADDITSGVLSIEHGGTGNDSGYIRAGQMEHITIGDCATAEGYSTKAIGNYAHAEGNNTTASGNHAHAEGFYTTANGICSHAEGLNTTADGDSAHAEGSGTTASGSSAHAEGSGTTASGGSAHAEGSGTTASGGSAHAEGCETTASDYYAHAEGCETTASGMAAHAEGNRTTAYGNYSHAEGCKTVAITDHSHSEGYGAMTSCWDATFVVSGINSTDKTITIDLDKSSGNLSKITSGQAGILRCVKSISSTSAQIKSVTITSISDNIITVKENISDMSGVYVILAIYLNRDRHNHAEGFATLASGDYSHAEGYLATASGGFAHAEGYETTASGGYAHAEGFYTTASGGYAHAEGYRTTASGDYAHAEGDQTTASGDYAHAEGDQTTASGESAHAEGCETTASGMAAHAEGFYTTASGDYAHAEGSETAADGNSAHAEGFYTTASGDYAHAEGCGTTASGYYVHAEGYRTTASGNCDHAEGCGTTASGDYAHAEGDQTTASGGSAHAEGCETTASGESAHAEGCETTASGGSAHAEGCETTASGCFSHAEGSSSLAAGNYSHAEGSSTRTLEGGSSSHAEGDSTIASGRASHAEGYETIASNFASHASGKYNRAMENNGDEVSTTGDVFVIGNGTLLARSNAFRVTYSGTVYSSGSGNFNASGADYAEYFEWEDNNPENTDRVGYFVTLNGDKIRIAQEGDYILGIVSGHPCIIGNADEDWLGRWEHDEFGRFIKEDVTTPVIKTREIVVIDKDHNGNPIQKTKTETKEINTPVLNDSGVETGMYTTELKHTEIPVVDEEGNPVYETHIELEEYETGEVIHGWRHKANPAYDATQKYIERKDRKEWDCVGMLGVLSVRDDGSCAPNGYCKVSAHGTATRADNYIPGATYRVITRVTDNVVKVIFR